MRSRLSLFLNDLSLDEILYLEEELDRRKEKYRRGYAVLSVQADKPVLRPEHMVDLGQFTREMRRYVSGSAAAGGGTLLAYAPEVSVLLFNTVAGACRTCSALLSGLPEFNGRFGRESIRIGVKLGLASGPDTLAPGSRRCVRSSPLVRRANQAAWRSSSNMLLMDENSYQEWPDKFSVAPVPFEIEGQRLYRTIPGLLERDNSKYDNDALLGFLRRVVEAKIATLKYDMEHVEEGSGESGLMRLVFEAYDPRAARNLIFDERVPVVEAPDRMDAVKRVLSSMGLALVRHELSAVTGC